MGAEARQLLGHIDTLGKQTDFQADAVVIECGRSIAQTGGELFLIFGNQGRHARLDGSDQFTHAGNAATNHLGQFFAFTAPGGDQFIQRGGDGGGNFRLQGLESDAVIGENTGPAQHFGDGQRRGLGQLGLNESLGGLQLAKQHAVNGQVPRCAILRLEIETTFDLAALELAGDRFAQHGLGLTQIVIDPEGKVEIAGIDAPQFEVQSDTAQVTCLDGVARHAVDHPVFPEIARQSEAKLATPNATKDEV